MIIGFIGNFEPYFSTENDRKWSLQMLGHNVVKFQENKTTAEDLSIMLPKLDLLLYSHTHGWEIPHLKDIFRIYRENRIPTVSIHLDRWAGLARESDIGVEATWFTEYLFMADFSPEAQALYKKHNLNAHYLKPGVVARDCYMAKPDPIRFPHEIVFVGSRGYHPEYAFRPELVDFLKQTYGDRFGHYGSDGLGVVRGHDLNVLMATAKIVVGDSCFGGRPNYVSDRYYETRGRGGFLLHPRVKGVDYEGVGFYSTEGTSEEKLLGLKKTINVYLQEDALREKLRWTGFTHVASRETYTQRMEKMLEVVCK